MVDIRNDTDEDKQEEIIMRGILHVITGNPAEISLSALARVQHALLVAISKDKQDAKTSINKIRGYLMGEVLKHPDEAFGYALQENNSNPIFHKDEWEK